MQSLLIQQQASEDLAIRMKSLEGLGEGFLQFILQFHFVSILWILGGGSLLYALDRNDFYYYTGKQFDVVIYFIRPVLFRK